MTVSGHLFGLSGSAKMLLAIMLSASGDPLQKAALEGAVTVGCRQHNFGAPDKLARGVAVGDQSLKL